MPAFIHARHVARALALLLVASLLATCGDDSSSSKDDRGVFGDMADVLQSAEDDFLTANAAIFASADSMKPYIAAILDLNTRTTASVSAPTSCLVEGAGGKIYSFNGESYSGIDDPNVPDYTARFRLYKLSSAGQPQLDHEIGHVDYTCVDVGVPVTETQIFSDSVLVASTTYSKQSGNISGTLRTPVGSKSLLFLGDLSLELVLNVRFVLSDKIQGEYRFPMGTSDTRRAEVAIAHAPATLWGLDIVMTVNGSGAVTDSGYALYRHYEGSSLKSGIAACIESGTLEAPVFSAPTVACYDGAEPMSVSHTQLAAISDSYQPLRALWLTTANLVEICRSLVPLGQ